MRTRHIFGICVKSRQVREKVMRRSLRWAVVLWRTLTLRVRCRIWAVTLEVAYFMTFVENDILGKTFGYRAVNEVVVELLVRGAPFCVTWRS